ncbi:hypothetical protein [Prosthecochloris sp.]|uniref:DUF2515 family protein n=1 Tax=Prosthecochloris sp. TaxID=290513 RepID=UPI0025D779BF|nr:hypothetical protein [Prosthecochloris sp.]
MLQAKEEWKAAAESRLPPPEEIVQRNRAITSHYARLYLDHHDIFKWAGMAAFASSQVGIALAFVEMMQTPARIMAHDTDKTQESDANNVLEEIGRLFAGAARIFFFFPFSVYDFASRNILLNDLEEIRKGNNAIYNDIAWAHMAYLDGGLEEVENNVAENEHEFLLSGFRLIDQGVGLMKSNKGSGKADALIREGNIRLLKHEQINTLGPIFKAISPQGRVVVSFGSELNFGDAAPPGNPSRASFADHFGYLDIVVGNKSVTNSEHRWQWIEECVLPAWYAVDEGFSKWEGTARRFRYMAKR